MSRSVTKPLILIVSNFYLPGYKSGGGMRTIANTVERLSDKYEFRIITRSYDAGEDRIPYEDVSIGTWNKVGSAEVFYLRKDRDIREVIPLAISEFRPAALYANSFFSRLTIETLKLRRTGEIASLPFIIAPCGELSPGALQLKRTKKKVFLRAAKQIGLYADLLWKASTEDEAREIAELNARNAKIFVAPDLPPASIFPEFDSGQKLRKAEGKADFVFLSRFDRKKNLKWFLENVSVQAPGSKLDVYGTVQDKEYLEEFLEAARKGTHGLEVNFKGPVPYEEVPQTLFQYHFLVMPTLGENFGHIFLESMTAGSPLLISDRTPWRDLEEKNSGWSIPLEDPASWQNTVARCVSMGEQEYSSMSESARRYALGYLASPDIESSTVALLDHAVMTGGARAA